MKVVNKVEAMRLLEEAVRVRGELTTISECMYERDAIPGQPGCIVGQAIYSINPELLTRIGIWERNVQLLDDRAPSLNDGYIEDTSFRELRAALEADKEMRFTSDAAKMFEQAQKAQDDGQPWGEVVEGVRRQWFEG